MNIEALKSKCKFESNNEFIAFHKDKFEKMRT